MKIKVKLKKRINERLGLSPTSDVNIEQLFRDLGVAKDSLESIFQKSLLFSLTDEFEWDTILISTTDKQKTLSLETT